MQQLMVSLVQRQSQRLKLTQSQRHEIVQSHILSLKLNLIHAMRGDDYRPEANCPSCSRVLKPLEIIKGFSADPNDYDTTCSGCGKRFPPKLRWQSSVSSGELPFYCDLQMQAKLRGLETLNPSEFRRQEPAVYHSAIVHCGTLRNAFSRVGIEYVFNEIEDRERKIMPFLGKLPDKIIAQYSGLTQKKIGYLRRKNKIRTCTMRNIV